MKICTIIGARPQFIKAAAVSRILRQSNMEVLIHTGQHYDSNMSDIFFEELSIPKPDYNLGIAGGLHGEMTGRMLIEIEKVFLAETPDFVFVYGDTNSTTAGALAAAKLDIPICHVEAGLRTRMKGNPEEINRLVTDRISSLLMCCTKLSVDELHKEGRHQGVYFTGDVMYDAQLFYGKHIKERKELLQTLHGEKFNLPEAYYYLTCHRQENTQTDVPLFEIFTAMQQLDAPVIYPVHPRNQKRALRLLSTHDFSNIHLTKPVGYLTSLHMCKDAKTIITDSGGLQREAYFYKKPCITIFPVPAWVETMKGNYNQISPAKADDILKKIGVKPQEAEWEEQFGDGHAAEKIVALVEEYEKDVMDIST